MLAVLAALALTQTPSSLVVPPHRAFAALQRVAQPSAGTAPLPLAADAPSIDSPSKLLVQPDKVRPNTVAHKARLFTAPRVSGEVLMARTGMSLLLGMIGGGVATGFVGLGHLLVGLTGSVAPIFISLPIAAGALGMATALGAALFGDDYGRDLLEATPLALMTSAISVLAAVSFWFLAPVTVITAVVVCVALVFPAIATPLTVQSFKPDGGPEASVPIAAF